MGVLYPQVLQALPLDLPLQPDSNLDLTRSYLLPLLKPHVRRARLAYWADVLMPAADALLGRHAQSVEGNVRTIPVCVCVCVFAFRVVFVRLPHVLLLVVDL